MQQGATDFMVYIVTEDFVEGAPLTTAGFREINQLERLFWLRDHSSTLERLKTGDCLKAYSSTILTEREDVLLTLYGPNSTDGANADFLGYV